MNKNEIYFSINGKEVPQLPHCDGKVLHAPKICSVCDEFEDWQYLREAWGINFTGEHDENKLPCPSEVDRPLSVINKWGGNIPVPHKKWWRIF